jgi:vacuolar-type H+-ATPase subunit D/Vma8
MEKMKILIKLLKVKGQLQAANDYQAMLMDKPLAIIEEVIEEITKDVEMRQQYEDECG